MEDEKLKKMKEILYSNPKYKNMKIGYRIEEGNYYLIYHYQKNFNIFDMEFHELMSKIIEEIKGLYKYNEEKERFETFTFNDKKIEKSKEKKGDDFTIPKKTKVNSKDKER